MGKWRGAAAKAGETMAKTPTAPPARMGRRVVAEEADEGRGKAKAAVDDSLRQDDRARA